MSAEQAGAQPHVFLELVRARERAALAGFAHATGDTSLCTLSRAGAPHPGAKFHEGRDWVAYYAGGVEALDLLAETVAASGGVPR